MTPLADCEAMAPLLAAFARGTRRSRLRQLVVVCPAGHTLVEVFPTPAGPHAVWQRPHRASTDGTFAESWRTEWMAAPLIDRPVPLDAPAAPRSGGAPAGMVFVTARSWASGGETETDTPEEVYLDATAGCRCTKSAHVDGRQLTEWLARGTRRAIAEI